MTTGASSSSDFVRERHPLLRQRVQTRLIACIFVILATVALVQLQALLIPMAVAVLITIVLHPAMHFLAIRLRLPLPAAAAVLLLLLLAVLVIGSLYLGPTALLWLERVPDQLRNAELELRDLTRPVEELRGAIGKLESMAGLTGTEDEPARVVTTDATLAAAILSRTTGFIVGSILTFALVFFFLAFGDAFLRRSVHALPRRVSRFHALTVIDSVRRDVGRYVVIVTVINIGLGLAVALVLWLWRIPNALLWGAMATLFNYVPYLGAIVGVVIITMVGLATYNDIAPALAIGACYYALTALEGTFVTPAILGRRLRVSPIVVFVGLLFWGWVWGIAGAVLAVPLLVGMKIAADHVRSLDGLAMAIGTEEADEAAGVRDPTFREERSREPPERAVERPEGPGERDRRTGPTRREDAASTAPGRLTDKNAERPGRSA